MCLHPLTRTAALLVPAQRRRSLASNSCLRMLSCVSVWLSVCLSFCCPHGTMTRKKRYDMAVGRMSCCPRFFMSSVKSPFFATKSLYVPCCLVTFCYDFCCFCFRGGAGGGRGKGTGVGCVVCSRVCVYVCVLCVCVVCRHTSTG